MSIVLDDLTARLDTLTKAVLSQPLAHIGCSRVTIRPLSLRGKAFFQLEYQHGQKVTHRNVTKGELPGLFAQELDGLYLQAVLCTETETRQYIRKTNGSYKCTAKGEAQRTAAPKAHDRRKEYILAEGENIPALVDLGVFTPDLRIVKAKYDKYKQINRFIELVDDAFRASEQQEITILDFGCGKSYLTFILYYYFTVKRGVKATILGYDLKEDVVEHCNAIAQKYGYDGLRFVVSDVTRDTLADTHVDMVVTLHACDTATDYALWYAVEKGVKHIFSVPCCQHEINATIHKGGDFDVLLRHGLLQERFSALLLEKNQGRICNITVPSTFSPYWHPMAYVASKAGQNTMIATMGWEFDHFHVPVEAFTIHPGATSTDLNGHYDGPGSHQPDVIGQKVAEIINDGKRHNGEFIELYPIVDEGNY